MKQMEILPNPYRKDFTRSKLGLFFAPSLEVTVFLEFNMKINTLLEMLK